MVPTDDRILEALREDGNLTPRALSRDADTVRVDVRRDHAGDRLRELFDKGLVERVDRGLYGISKEGRGYLDERYDAETGEWIDTGE
jgi:DeoR/GlpR family transcriptional regulator of sugar metabolism